MGIDWLLIITALGVIAGMIFISSVLIVMLRAAKDCDS